MPDETDEIKTDDDLRDTMAALLADVPAPVQAFITNGKLEEVALGISNKFKMRVDQAGKFQHALLLMLLGVYEPGQFITKLQDAGIPNQVISGTVADLEESVFIPLRKAEAAAPAAIDVSAARPVPVLPVPAPFGATPSSAMPASAPGSVPAIPPVAPKPAEPAIIDPFAAMTQASAAPIPAPTPPPSAAEPLMRTMAHDVEAMQSGVAPAPAPYTPIQAPAPLPQQPLPPPPPIAPTPIAQAPAIPPAPVIPPSQIPAAPEIPRTPQRTPDPDIHEVTSTLQKYGIDPYREPPE